MLMTFDMVVNGFTSISNMVGDNDFVLSFDYLVVYGLSTKVLGN